MDDQCSGKQMRIRDWLIHLSTDTIRTTVNAYRDAYETVRAQARDAGVETTDVWESEARYRADIAFLDSLLSTVPEGK